MVNQRHHGFQRLLYATGYSWEGLKAAWRNEEAFRQESLMGLVLTPLALWLGDSNLERVLLIGSLLLVIIAELLNSGLEAVVDRIGSQPHELSKRAKDIGSAAVFVSLVNAALVWVLLLF